MDGVVWAYFFAALITLSLIYGSWRMGNDSVVTEHNVLILAKLPDGDFAYKSDEKQDGDTFRPCQADQQKGIDVDGMLTKAVGYVAVKATWKEMGTCRSLLRPEWQFWFRSAENNFTYRRVQ